MNSRSWTVTAFCMLLIAYASIASEPFKNDPVPKVNNEAGLALKGYDPVAYFEDGKPSLGHPAIGYRWRGILYHFVSEQHRKAFIDRPARYLPQYGGYCAYAVSEGTTADGAPSTLGDRRRKALPEQQPPSPRRLGGMKIARVASRRATGIGHPSRKNHIDCPVRGRSCYGCPENNRPAAVPQRVTYIEQTVPICYRRLHGTAA